MTMNLEHAIRTRCSGGRLLDESPRDEDIAHLLALAMNAPDHADLRPWRFVVIRGDQRKVLGKAMRAATGDESTQDKPLRAPLLLGIVFTPQAHPKVPRWEQLCATTGVVTLLSLLLHGRGWAAMWRSGPSVQSVDVRSVMGVAPDEELLGWLYVGRPDPAASRPPRRLNDPSDHLVPMGHAMSISAGRQA
jgi:nitroreductase